MAIGNYFGKGSIGVVILLTIIASPPHQKPIKTEMGGTQTLKSVGVVMETNELSQNLTRVPGLKNKLLLPFVYSPTLVTTNVTMLGSTEQTPHPKVDTPPPIHQPQKLRRPGYDDYIACIVTTTVQTVQLRRPSRLASYDDLLTTYDDHLVTTTIQTIQLRRPSRLASYDDQPDCIVTTTIQTGQLRRPSYEDQLDHIVTTTQL